MPIRFRRTFKVLPGVKVNLSRGGISTSVGPRGFHLTFSKRGVRQSIGLPGTGLSETSYLVKNEPDAAHHEVAPEAEHEAGEVGCFPWGCLIFVVIALVLAYAVANFLGFIPPNYLSHLLQQIGL